MWHWIFSITAGGLAGWSLAQWQNEDGEAPARGDLMRGVLSIAAIIGFTYNGWMVSVANGVATLAVCLVAAALAYGAGRLRIAQLRAEAADDEEEPVTANEGEDVVGSSD